MRMPLEPNRNHQFSAFAGSLNALCTIAGWGGVFLMLRGEGLAGNIVIRRSQIRYFRPVRSAEIVAQTLPPDAQAEAYFFELLRSKGRSKIDMASQIIDADGPLVSFSGSYVIQD
jgi:thioesterase domain-containing protein